MPPCVLLYRQFVAETRKTYGGLVNLEGMFGNYSETKEERLYFKNRKGDANEFPETDGFS